MSNFAIYLITLYLIVTPLAVLLWPRRRLVLWLWSIPAIIVYPLFWQTPGVGAVVIGMATLLIFLRALDANVSYAHNSGLHYALYCHWLLPHQTERKDADPLNKRFTRLLRGSLFIIAAVSLASLGKHLELWHNYPYLDDLLMAAELSLGFVGIIEVITVLLMTLRLQFFLADSFSADFALAPSLRAFWNQWWNRPTSGVLNRGIFLPAGGKRYRMRGLLLVFFACGLMHAVPLLLAGEQKLVWLIVAIGSLLFFIIQALALSLEQFLPRKVRRGAPARLYLYLTMAISLPLYPAPALIALGVHDRPIETATILRLTSLIYPEYFVVEKHQ